MNPDESSCAWEDSASRPSVADAKRDLLAWGVRADEELHAQVAASIASAKSGAKALIPWATLAATGISVLLRLVRGGGTKTKQRSSVLGTVIRGAIDLWPFVGAMMQARK